MSSQKSTRRLFNRPAWAATSSSSTSAKPVAPGNDDFFSRSEHTFSAIAAADAEERAKRREARKAKGPIDVSSRSEEDPSPKRRRVSGENDDIHESADRAGAVGVNVGKADGVYEDEDEDEDEDDDFDDVLNQPTSRSKGKKHDPSASPVVDQPRMPPQAASHIPEGVDVAKPETDKSTKVRPVATVELSDDNDGDEDSKNKDSNELIEITAEASVEQKAYASSEDEDDEFAELARQAREKNRRKLVRDDAVAESHTKAEIASDSPGTELLSPMGPADHAGSSSPAASEPVVSFCITSDIPNTEPLIIKRTLSQRLKEARLYWCNRHQLPPGDIVLTWRGQIWFDSMSARDFQIGVDGNGELLPMATDGWPEQDPYRGKIHLLAMTESQYEQNKGKRLAGYDHEAQAGSEVEQQRQQPGETGQRDSNTADEQPQEKFRVVLRAKGYEEQKLIVLPSTGIQRMADVFTHKSSVPRSKRVVLVFEGETLDPSMTVGQTEIEDMVLAVVDVASTGWHSSLVFDADPAATRKHVYMTRKGVAGSKLTDSYRCITRLRDRQFVI